MHISSDSMPTSAFSGKILNKNYFHWLASLFMVAESFGNCLGLVEGLSGEARGEEVGNRFLYGNKTYHLAACFEYESGVHALKQIYG